MLIFKITKAPVYYLTLPIAMITLSSCISSDIESRINLANNIASQNELLKNNIKTRLFNFIIYEKVNKQGALATIYIEGDGLAWLNRSTPSRNPTPRNPVGLRLASSDNLSDNIIYIARPCQYAKMSNTQPCDMKYWTSKRFSPEVINNIDDVLNNIKTRHKITGFNLVGYSGGAAIAVLIASKRSDVVSLRTVAGNINNKAFSSLHNVSKMPASLNPADVAHQLKDMPQHHFIGANDKIIPLSIYKSYKSAMGKSTCANYTLAPAVDHSKGWQKIWASLLRKTIECS